MFNIGEMPRKGPEMGDVKPWWLDLVLIGFEDDDDSDDDEDVDDEEDDEEEDDESDEDDEDSDDEDEEDEDEDEEDKSKSKKKNIGGLKSALRKERMGHKKYKRLYQQQLAKQKGKKPDSSKKEEEQEEDTGPTERERKLAVSLRNTAIDTVIQRYATKAGFLDPEDAVKLVKRSEIEYDQDEEDPTLIEIDEESVEDAVKDLARKKKHLLGSRNGKTRTGSKFGGKKKKGVPSDDTVRAKYGLARPTM